MPTPQTNDWEEEFDKKFFWDGEPMGLSDFQVEKELKPFISSLLSKKAEELNKGLEGKKSPFTSLELIANKHDLIQTYNSALSTAQELVKEIIK